MKKILVISLAVIFVLSMAACGAEPGGSQAPGSDTTLQTPHSISSAPEADSTQTISSDTEPDMITGTLYALFAEGDIREADFGYEEGACTPERIAEALTEWTGLVYDITSTTIDGDAVIVDWKSSSSFAEGQPPDPQKEGFEFYDQVTMRWFMLNSLCSSIRVNMGVSDVFYSIEGGDLNDLGLDQDFNPAIAYNRIDNINVVIM